VELDSILFGHKKCDGLYASARGFADLRPSAQLISGFPRGDIDPRDAVEVLCRNRFGSYFFSHLALARVIA
jgi:hypothetical protein